MVRSIRRAFTAGTVISAAVTAAWAYSAVLTTAGMPAALHLTRHDLPGDYLRLAGAPTGNGPGLFAVTAAIYTACFTVAGLRRIRSASRTQEGN